MTNAEFSKYLSLSPSTKQLKICLRTMAFSKVPMLENPPKALTFDVFGTVGKWDSASVGKLEVEYFKSV